MVIGVVCNSGLAINEYIINAYAEKAGDSDGAELDDLNIEDLIDVSEVA